MKIVNESLNELYKFEKKTNHLSSLGIGKRTFIEKWLDDMHIHDYVINDDLTIDVLGYVYLDGKTIIKFPDYIQFNIVEHDFECRNCNLITLKGCPKIVKGMFNCNDNKLTSLEGGPEISGSFYCSRNFLENFEGCPKEIKSIFVCTGNKGIKLHQSDVEKICNVRRDITVS